MDKKWISIIVPCYNTESYIVKCLESVINQTVGMDKIELIIINDASTDNSLIYLLKYKELYPDSIILLNLEENKGQGNARNIGIRHVSSPYFVFLDADDWLEPDFCEKMLKPTYEYEYDLVQCTLVEHIEGLEPNYVSLKSILGKKIIFNDTERKEFLNQYHLSSMVGCSLYRTKWITDQNISFKSFLKYEDNYWGGLIEYVFQSYYGISEALYHYRILRNSNSHARNDIRHFERLKVEVEKLNYYNENGLYYTYYNEIRDSFLRGFYINTLHIICCQFDYIPLEVIRDMQDIVRELFPNYLEEYCKNHSLFIDPVITVAFDFPLEVWKKYKEAYCLWLNRGEETQIAQFYFDMRSALKF